MQTSKKRTLACVLKIAAFFLVLSLILGLLSVSVFSKKMTPFYHSKYSSQYTFLEEKDNTIQIAGLGNSDLYSAVTPIELWRQKGYDMFLMCAPSQTISQSQDILEDVFEHHSPKLVIIETDMFYKEFPERGELHRASALDEFLFCVNPRNLQKNIEKVFPVFKFHNAWKKPGELIRNNAVSPYSNGYHLSFKIGKHIKFYDDYMEKSEETDYAMGLEEEDLDSLVGFARDNGAEVMLVSVPCTTNWTYKRHNYVARYAQKNGLVFTDFNLLKEEAGLDRNRDFRDRGTHLNYYGAVKLTRLLGDIISENYKLEDCRSNPEYEFMNARADSFEKEVAAEENKVRKGRNDR